MRPKMFMGGVLGLLALAGCSRWQKAEVDTVWVAPNRQAVEERKEYYNWNAGTLYHLRWVDAQNAIHDPRAIAAHAEDFLVSTPYGADIVASMSTNVPPWQTIVSINPIVVLLVPSDLEKAKKGWLLGTNHPCRSVGPSRAGDGYDCGSVVLYNKGMHWFSPNLKQQPKEVLFSASGAAEITLPDGKLALQVDGEVCRIKRK